jgi:hypothetical protein
MVAEAIQSKGEALERVPFEQYVDMPDLHATALKDMLTSPRLYKARRERPKQDNDTLRRGRATHTAVLEPRRFLADYVLWEGKRRAGKEWEALKERAGDKTILTVEQYETANKIADAIHEHAIAGPLLAERTARRELTLRWRHARTGLRCKARVDLLGSALVDVKTTRNPDPRKFAADCARYGYALQMAFYADGVASVLGTMPPVKIIAAQSVEPFDVVVFALDEQTQRIGSEQVEKAIDLVAACIAANDWPGIASSEEVTLRLPAWAAPDYSEDGPDESQPIEDTDF